MGVVVPVFHGLVGVHFVGKSHESVIIPIDIINSVLGLKNFQIFKFTRARESGDLCRRRGRTARIAGADRPGWSRRPISRRKSHGAPQSDVAAPFGVGGARCNLLWTEEVAASFSSCAGKATETTNDVFFFFPDDTEISIGCVARQI